MIMIFIYNGETPTDVFLVIWGCVSTLGGGGVKLLVSTLTLGALGAHYAHY